MKSASEQIAAKLAPAKKERKAPPRRKPGLLHSLRGVEIEDVSLSMRRACATCGTVPKVRRLLVKQGSGRHAKVLTYCISCGLSFLDRSREEYLRAWQYLRLGEVEGGGGIRL